MRHESDFVATRPTLAYFVDDIPGGVLVECGYCEHQQKVISVFGTPTHCGECQRELFYPSGVEW